MNVFTIIVVILAVLILLGRFIKIFSRDNSVQGKSITKRIAECCSKGGPSRA